MNDIKLKADEIKNIIKQIDEKEKIIIYGSGKHTDKLFECTRIKNKNIQCIVDKDYKNIVISNGYNVLSPEVLRNQENYLVIISSFQFQDDIEQYLIQNLNYKGRIIKLYSKFDNQPFYNQEVFDYKNYWNNRYLSGETSGEGSYGILAQFKADVINDIIDNNDFNTFVEFGCGDGNQLSLMKYKKYIGFDIADSAIKICKDKFNKDINKEFHCYVPENIKSYNIGKADMVVCLDVLYHIINEEDFVKTLDGIFNISDNYIVIYTIIKEPEQIFAKHIKYRNILEYTKKYLEFKVVDIVYQKYPELSLADFIIYKKIK